MPYSISSLTPEERDALFQAIEPRLLFTRKSDIYGCCVKLLTDDDAVRRKWDDNFYAMSESVRSYARLVSVRDPSKEAGVQYEPLSRTAFAFNLEYYGWIKSVALALAGDVLEDEHSIYSVHGAALDIGGEGVALIAPSKTGKTTHAWGLLRLPDARLITDDWFFVRLSDRRHLAFGSEKNCYVDAGIANIWPEYKPLVERAQLDDEERAIMNVRWIIGPTGVIPMTSMRHAILLKRDNSDPRVSRSLDTDEALQYLLDNDFCNPHQLVRNERKLSIRTDFFRRFLDRVDVHLVNTILAPEETQREIRQLIRRT